MNQDRDNGGHKLTALALAAGAALLTVGFSAASSMAADIKWTGADDGTNWSNPLNWQGNAVPGASDKAIFDSTGGTNLLVTVDTAQTVKSISAGPGYTIGSTTGSAITLVGDGDVTGNGATIAAPLVLASNPSFANSSGQVLVISGNISTGDDTTARTLRQQNSWGTVTFTGAISGPITIAPNVQFPTGQRVTNLNNANTNTGGVAHVHSIAIVNLNATGAVTDSRATTGRGGHFVVNAQDAITGSSYVTILDGDVVPGGNPSYYSASITFNFPNDYTGDTTIGIGRTAGAPGGELWANNKYGSATGSGDVLINAGLLAGDGFIDNSSGTKAGGTGVTLKAGARLSPGAAAAEVGTLTLKTGSKGVDITGAVAGTNTGALIFDLGSTFTGQSDQVLLDGSTQLKFGADTLEFDDFVFNPLAGFAVDNVYMLFVGGGANTIVGGLGANISGPIGDFEGILSIDDNHQAILLTIVPEPASLSILALGALGLLARRRRKADLV